MHPRKLIRDKVVQLLTGATLAAERVYPTRIVPYKKGGALPVIAVYTLAESVDPQSVQSAPRELTRDLSLVIEAWVDGAASDDALDALAEQIECVMERDPFLEGTAAQSVLSETETEVVTEGDRPMGILMLTYSITYRTYGATECNPGPQDDFYTAGTTYDIGGTTHAGNHAHDVITVQEPPTP